MHKNGGMLLCVCTRDYVTNPCKADRGYQILYYYLQFTCMREELYDDIYLK